MNFSFLNDPAPVEQPTPAPMTYNQKCEYIAQRIMQGHHRALLDDSMIDLPTPQRTGTYFQRFTYALIKARDIVDNSKTPTA